MRCMGRLNAARAVGLEPGLSQRYPPPLALVNLRNSPHAFTHSSFRGGDAPTRALPSGPVADTELFCLAASNIGKLPQLNCQIDS